MNRQAKKLLLLPCAISLYALGFALPKPVRLTDSVEIKVQLDYEPTNERPADSLYIIFDKYDRSGAGVVKQVFYPVNNEVRLVVPKGKYYVDVYGLGLYSGYHMDKVMVAHKKRKNTLRCSIKGRMLFVSGEAVIPVEKIDWTHLTVLANVNHR